MNTVTPLQMESTSNISGDISGDFCTRHIGPAAEDVQTMLEVLGYKTLDSFISKVVPQQIRMKKALTLGAFPEALSEEQALARLKGLALKNRITKSYLGYGYSDCFTPTVIQRNILENPGWYTQYTPYQPEISQGRLEALLNYQTMIVDLTGLDIANASLLDEGTAAAESMSMSLNVCEKDYGDAKPRFLVASNCHPQTIAVVAARAEALGVQADVLAPDKFEFVPGVFGVLLQYPGTRGEVVDYSELCVKAHTAGALVTVATDPLALLVLKSPGEMGADFAVGNSQRFGVPLGFGGPHAAFFATKDAYKRQMAGRLIGVSRDAQGGRALRLSLQTREQHIRREKATSNICTAQVLLAIMAGMYAVYHGPKRLTAIATRVHDQAVRFAAAAKANGLPVVAEAFFDTVELKTASGKELARAAEKAGILIRVEQDSVVIALDETTSDAELETLLGLLTGKKVSLGSAGTTAIPAAIRRTAPVLAHPIFNRYHSETEFLRYVRRLEAKDLSLGTAMIPLGSCTMKLNATSEMVPVTWAEFGKIHPFAPKEHIAGYLQMFAELEEALADVTGFSGVSLQPNAGSQGEYAGLLVIRAYHMHRNEGHRTICLIPRSAHGTNPASAVMAGLRVVPVECDANGNVDVDDLIKKADEHRANLAALMVTYPSTHGVFEERIQEICAIIHERGGQVYLDGANLNALVGLVQPEAMGADVCHINLHKTFCIPHGGGGPGMGPIGVRKHLEPYLPKHPFAEISTKDGVGPVSAAPWGSASILPISWMYMAMMGAAGVTRATEIAILNANYIAKRLEGHYPVLYKGTNGHVAHECILDLRDLKKLAGIEVDDVAKRLIDYGFHAPTVSWPVPGTVMVEPTESESIEELDRFCDAMIMIRDEIREIEAGQLDKINNPLKNAPHTAAVVVSDQWDKPYSRERAAFPTPATKASKFWPAVGRVDGIYGDKNLVCACPPMESYE